VADIRTIVVTAIVTTAANQLPAAVRYTRYGLGGLISRRRADHRSLDGGWYFRTNSSNQSVLTVRCAPDRRRLASDLDVAEDWVKEVFPGWFKELPSFSSPDEMVRFEGREGDPTLLQLCIWPSGLIELARPIPIANETVDAMDIASPIVTLIRAVRAGAYAKLYGRGAAKWRIDWEVEVGLHTSTEDGWVYANAVLFPGMDHQVYRATNMSLAAIRLGRGSEFLQSKKQDEEAAELIRPIFLNLLRRGGFRRYDGAIDKLIEAIET
jgi:hypothetical protein